MFQSEQAVLPRPHRGPGELERGIAREELLEHHAHLQAGQVRAQAVVDALSEAEMEVRIAPDVEAERLREDALVAVRRHFPERELLAGPDLLAVEFDVTGRGAPLVDRTPRPAH